MSDQPPVVELQDIRKSFGAVQALRGVDLRLQENEVLGLVGDNAAGKSTLMKVLSGAYIPDGGEIYIEGQKVRFTGPEDARQLGIEMVYQDFALASVRLKVENLSGGQRQAVAIGRATAFNAKVIIMDEPTAALSVAAIGKVLDLIRELKRQGSSIIIISHRLEDIFEAADRVVVLRHGRKVGDLSVRGASLAEIREQVVARIVGAVDDFAPVQ
jgi:simple sugar transport system ATP-binding protein